jgi:hypothetical protein
LEPFSKSAEKWHFLARFDTWQRVRATWTSQVMTRVIFCHMACQVSLNSTSANQRLTRVTCATWQCDPSASRTFRLAGFRNLVATSDLQNAPQGRFFLRRTAKPRPAGGICALRARFPASHAKPRLAGGICALRADLRAPCGCPAGVARP